jgi:pimeloyl-ACP methyl ester carboxylesterase
VAACGASKARTPAPSPVPDSIVSAPVRVAHTSSGAVAYRTVGSGPPLVLIMGYGGTMETWDPRFVDALARSFRVVVSDNAGTGGTRALPGALTIDGMADQTSALVAWLGLGRANVLGWSMGAVIAQALAARHPDQVRRLVLCAPLPGDGSAVVPSQSVVAALTNGPPAAASAALYPADHVISSDAAVSLGASYPSHAPVSTSTLAAQRQALLRWFAGRDPAGRQTSRIGVPTLVADGIEDKTVAIANDRTVARLIHGARLVLYPDAGHAFLFQEGTPFVLLVKSLLIGAPKPVALKAMREQFTAGEARLAADGKIWEARLRKLNPYTNPGQLARIDLAQAEATARFDELLLGFGARGRLGSAITTFVAAEGRLVDDFAVPATRAQFARDGARSRVAFFALRRQLGVS